MAKSKQGGFALVEALITATVVTVGMLMVGQMLMVGTKGTRTLRERSVVTNVAQRELETLRAQGYDALSRLTAASADGYHARLVTTVAVNHMTGKTLGDGGQSLPTLLPPGYKLYSLTRDILHRENDLSTVWDNQIQLTVELESLQTPGKAVSVASLINRSIAQ